MCTVIYSSLDNLFKIMVPCIIDSDFHVSSLRHSFLVESSWCKNLFSQNKLFLLAKWNSITSDPRKGRKLKLRHNSSKTGDDNLTSAQLHSTVRWYRFSVVFSSLPDFSLCDPSSWRRRWSAIIITLTMLLWLIIQICGDLPRWVWN